MHVRVAPRQARALKLQLEAAGVRARFVKGQSRALGSPAGPAEPLGSRAESTGAEGTGPAAAAAKPDGEAGAENVGAARGAAGGTVLAGAEGPLDVFFDGDPAVDLPPGTEVCGGCAACKNKSQNGTARPPARRFNFAVYPPLLLLATGTQVSAAEAAALAAEHACTHVAVNAVIQTDRVRRPQIEAVVGDFGAFVETEPTAADLAAAFWCSARQNGIAQVWAPLYTMFSRGNVTEKKRVRDTFAAQNAIKDTTVVDLYSGIGYFSFSYMANAPRRVLCWEINPWSVEGLVRGAHANGWPVRVVRAGEPVGDARRGLVVFLEDNQRAPARAAEIAENENTATDPAGPLGPVSHINMGLLPDARAAWPVARALAAPETVVHVHENVRTAEIEQWTAETAAAFGPALHVEKIKMYAPGVAHLCGDFRVA